MSLDDLIADTAEQRRHPFKVVIGNVGHTTGYDATTALELASWARGAGREARITRNGRQLWPREPAKETGHGRSA